MKNEVQLIAYADRFGRDLRELRALLSGPLAQVFGGVHVLPFYYPIDGADAGFDPIDHTEVDARLGSWADVRALADDVEVVADVIVNHISRRSPQFEDFAAKGAASEFAGLFLTYRAVFPQGASEQDLLAIYRPRPGLPFTSAVLANGERRLLWTTFTPEQIDIDVRHPRGVEYLDGILDVLGANGVKLVRLDAVGYAIKKAGRSCFMMAETFDFIDAFSARVRRRGMEVLVEIHAHYSKQIEVAERVDWTYDFALPPLLLHAFFAGTAQPLKRWIALRPSNVVTVLDTHDGIGVIDVAADGKEPGLLTDAEVDALVRRIHENSRGQSEAATGAAAANLDLYQVNCTFYDALGADDLEYLLCRAIQLFVPGIPQVYYVGLLAGANDMDLLARTGVGRDINRRYYGANDVVRALERPVVERLLALIRLRNTHPAFDGQFEHVQTAENALDLRWRAGDAFARLFVSFDDHVYRLEYSDRGAAARFVLLDHGAERWRTA